MKKSNIIVIIICIFIFFISTFLMWVSRKYLFIETMFKNINSSINTYFISKIYDVNKTSDNVSTTFLDKALKENNELRKSVQLSKKDNTCISAEIINHNSLYWFSRLEINKGTNDGIKLKEPVINTYGLVGFISKISNNVSEVTLLTSVNKDNMISVMINDNVAGMLSGYDKKKKLFIVSNITSKESIKQGDVVSLSNYLDSNYKDIYIGRVLNEKDEDYGLTKKLYVKSDIDFDNLLFVCVRR